MQYNRFIGKAKRSVLLTLHLSVFASAMLMTSCLDETFPTSSITAGQMQQSESSLEAQNVAMAASVMNYGSTYSHAAYPALMIWREVYCDQLPVYTTTYDYFGNSTSYLGDGQLFYDWWYQYYNTIHNANALVRLVDPAKASPSTLVYLGNALGYRAWCYLEASQLWEFKRTGVTVLDQQADENELWGLTVPIVSEKTSMEESRQNPRAPFYTMYRFIQKDLKEAAVYLKGYQRSQVNEMNQAAICALSARFWLMLGSRFEMAPADLALQLAHENDEDGYEPLNITTAADCYAKAAEFAQWAIDLGGKPTSREQWLDAKTGFNSAIDSWLFGIEMVADDNDNESWKNFVSFMSSETNFGVANSTYQAQRLCDADLFKHISKSDWRRLSWIAPEDAGKLDACAKYATVLTESEFAAMPELTNLKFHPAAGERSAFKEAAAIDLPIMRVEEMYYILAEAKAHTEGVAAGAQVLTDFTNLYRYTDGSYVCNATTVEELVQEVILQKRIEFWGEGIVFWDYKRLCQPVKRKYSGSNHPSTYQHNSPAGVVARWMNAYIPSNEYQYNKAIRRNPDPSRTDEMEY